MIIICVWTVYAHDCSRMLTQSRTISNLLAIIRNLLAQLRVSAPANPMSSQHIATPHSVVMHREWKARDHLAST